MPVNLQLGKHLSSQNKLPKEESVKWAEAMRAWEGKTNLSVESEKWSHSSGAISSSPVKDEINKDTGYSTGFKPKVFACIKKAVVFLLAEAQQMFWTFLNRWSWGLEH